MGIIQWGDWPWSFGLESLGGLRYRSIDPVLPGAGARMADNVLYYGDNLGILRRFIKDESVDLVYLDPPFNSNQTYNVLFAAKDGTEAAAQIEARPEPQIEAHPPLRVAASSRRRRSGGRRVGRAASHSRGRSGLLRSGSPHNGGTR